MAKSKQMLYLERQVTKLKRELAAAKRAQRVSEFAVQQYKGRAELAQAQTSDYAQRLEEQYDEVTIARLQHYEYVTSWQQVGYTLLQILRTPLSQRWYNLKQPVLNWYAVKRLSDDRIQAMTEAGYNADPVKRAKVARRYWEHDKEARRTRGMTGRRSWFTNKV